jgi:hypothetical protein
MEMNFKAVCHTLERRVVEGQDEMAAHSKVFRSMMRMYSVHPFELDDQRRTANLCKDVRTKTAGEERMALEGFVIRRTAEMRVATDELKDNNRFLGEVR